MKPRYFVFGKPDAKFGVGVRIGPIVLHYSGCANDFYSREEAMRFINSCEIEGCIYLSSWTLYTP